MSEQSTEYRIRLLILSLSELTELYRAKLSQNQISWSYDLIEKIEVGCLRDQDNDSDLAQELRNEGYLISEADSEFSLQVRIANLLRSLMPAGAWMVD